MLLAAATGVLAFFGLIAGYSVNRSIARPLIKTLNALESVAEGDLDQKIELGHTDEMGRIATSLNTAIRRMKHDREEIQRLAATDALTGLMNRRAFSETVTKEISRARRYGHPLTLLLFDIDHFKRINDKHGHAVGDIVLGRVGKLINEQLRTSDVAGRWGGEEFVVALPHVGLDGAAVVAARVRIACQDLDIVTEKGRQVPVTVSIGVAELGREDTLHALTERADHGMYLAKKEGRNRVVINDGTLVSMPPASLGPVSVGKRVG
jgi:diguanylate cyclase (GGDEF)-like protein